MRDGLGDDLGRFRHDPLTFVKYAFPWGEAGTALAGESGPHPWQQEILEEIGAQLRAGAASGAPDVIRHAIASGHGVGKSALVAWVTAVGAGTFSRTRG